MLQSVCCTKVGILLSTKVLNFFVASLSSSSDGNSVQYIDKDHYDLRCMVKRLYSNP